MINAQVLQFLLVIWLVSTSVLALLHLRACHTPKPQIYLWGLVACFPGVGPMLIFLTQTSRQKDKE
jgi:hypothetical protein